MFNMFSRTKREHSAALQKHVYLKDDELWYRSISRNLGIAPESSVLADVYTALIPEAERHEKAVRFYFLILGAGLLVALGLLDEISFSGAEFSKTSLSLFVLVLLGGSSLVAAWVQVKVVAATFIFDKVYEKSDSYDRALLLLKYPKAYGAHRYFASPNLHSRFLTSASLPFRQIVLAVFALLSAILLAAIPLFVFVVLSEVVWFDKSLGNWGKIFVAMSAGASIFSWLLPTGSFLKKKYDHGGLVYLLNRKRESDPEGYKRVAQKINALKDVRP